MSRRTVLLLLVALAALLLAEGCRSVRQQATTIPPTVSPSGPAPDGYTLVAFSGTAQGMGFSGQLRVAKDSCVWLSVSKVVELGRAVATPDSLHVRAPLVGRNFDGTYADFQRAYGPAVSFRQLQALALSDDIEAEMPRLARTFGIEMDLRLKRREHPERLSFPFKY